MDHDILLAKLEHYGIRGAAHRLLKSYLEDREQYVVYGGYESERGPQECGVPQGSVLGPLFFILYVNDMVRVCQDLDLVLFADDTNVFIAAKNLKELITTANQGLEKLSKWFRCNRLTLNLKKTEYVFFGGPKAINSEIGTIRIGTEHIRRVNGVRFLGVWVDESLKWTPHMENVKTKVSQLLGVLGRVRTFLGGSAIRALYNGMVLPHLQYCLLVWGDTAGARNGAIRKSLLRYQKRFCGMIAGKTGSYHSDPLFAKHAILKVGDLYRQQLRVHAWQFWNGRLPESQALMFQRVSEMHTYSTRNAESGLSLMSRDRDSISFKVPREWSLLPERLKGLKSLAAFKRQSRQTFIATYRAFECQQSDCWACRGGDRLNN